MAMQEQLYAGYGGSQATSRAAQLAAARAANAARLAGQIAARNRRPRPAYGDSRGADWRETRGPGRVPPRPAGPPPKPKAPPKKKKPKSILGEDIFDPSKGLGGVPGLVGQMTQPDAQPDTQDAVIPGEGGKPDTVLPRGSVAPLSLTPQVKPVEIDRFAGMTPDQQEEIRKNYKEGNLGINRGDEGKGVTVDQMLDDVMKDPLATQELKGAAQELADGFRLEARNKFFTNDDLLDNPLLGALNDLSAWSSYRRQVSAWKEGKKKTGEATLEDEPGDGTYSGMVDNGSFASVTSPSNLSPYLVARDENGLLYVTTADKWIQAKYADMHKDPALAAQIITALAVTSYYGTDTSSNAQRSRIVVDKDGNPVKGLANPEDAAALKKLANDLVIFQNMGEEVAVDDMLAETIKLGFEVAAETTAAGDYEGGGSGRGGGGGFGGFGGGGGGGGGAGAVRYTDATQLTSFVSSIARQRMGRELTPEEAALFVDYYHKMEESQTAAYFAGQSNTQLDPEGQAIAWINAHFGNTESAAHQYGNLAFELFNMMGGSNPFAGVT